MMPYDATARAAADGAAVPRWYVAPPGQAPGQLLIKNQFVPIW